MSEDDVLEVFKHEGVILTGHFVGTSGKHLDTYVDKDRVSMNPVAIAMLAAGLACELRDEKIEVVIAPALGAIVLGQWVAYHLCAQTGVSIKFLIAEKVADPFLPFVLRPKEEDIKGKRTLVVDDILTTGGSAAKVVKVAKAAGAEVVAVGALCNRGGVTALEVGDVPRFVTLLNLKLNSWDYPCPLCDSGVPVNTNVGKGKEFLAKIGLKS